MSDVVEFDDLPDPVPGGAVMLVVDVSDSNVDGGRVGLDVGSNPRRVAVTGALSPSSRHAIDISINSIDAGSEGVDYAIESFATINTSGDGRRGINARNNVAAHTGLIEAINHGSITTSGDTNLPKVSVARLRYATSAQAEDQGRQQGHDHDHRSGIMGHLCQEQAQAAPRR